MPRRKYGPSTTGRANSPKRADRRTSSSPRSTAFWPYLQVRGPLSEAFSLATRIVDLAKGTEDLVLIAGAYRRLGWCCFCYGLIAEGRQHLAHAANLYDPAKAKTYVDVHNADPGVLGSINLAWVEWFGGDVDRAREYSRRAREAARALDHPLSLAYALTMSAAVAQGLDDVEATHEFATRSDSALGPQCLRLLARLGDDPSGLDDDPQGAARGRPGHDARRLAGLRGNRRPALQALRAGA